jgi:putative redox protein
VLQATIKQVQGFAMLGRSTSNHWVAMDASSKVGGQDGAVRPKELLLLGLGGCAAFDVETVLRKRRVELKRFEVEMEADESAEHPMIITEVRMDYVIEGENVPTADVERAIRLSHEKYCAVSAMMRRVFPIRWRALVNGEEVLSGVEHETEAAAG